MGARAFLVAFFAFALWTAATFAAAIFYGQSRAENERKASEMACRLKIEENTKDHAAAVEQIKAEKKGAHDADCDFVLSYPVVRCLSER